MLILIAIGGSFPEVQGGDNCDENDINLKINRF